MVAAEFAATPDATVNTVLELVQPMVSEKKFGKLYPQALAYLAAHWLAWQTILAAAGSSGGAATAGSITAEREGDLSRQYADKSTNQVSGDFANNLDRTAYGLEYRRIARLVIVPIITR